MGLICLVAALAAATLWLPALQRESDTLEASADLAEQRARRIATPRTATAPPFTPEQRFRDAFPSARLRQERLAALLALARDLPLGAVPLATHRAPVRPLPLRLAAPTSEDEGVRAHWDVWFGMKSQYRAHWDLPAKYTAATRHDGERGTE